jgi:hypothetical protein
MAAGASPLTAVPRGGIDVLAGVPVRAAMLRWIPFHASAAARVAVPESGEQCAVPERAIGIGRPEAGPGQGDACQ